MKNYLPILAGVVIVLLVVGFIFTYSGVRSLRTDLDTTKNVFESTYDSFDRTKAELDHLVSELSKADARLRQAKSELVQFSIELGQGQTTLSRINADLDQIKPELTQISSMLVQTQAELAQAQDELAQVQEAVFKILNPPRPSSHWKFDETSGIFARDDGGHENHGTISGPKWVRGKFGGALQFDGIDDQVTISDDHSLDLTGNMTISLWYYSDDHDTGSIVRKGGSGNFGAYAVYRDEAGRVGFGLNGDAVHVLTPVLKNRQWYHIACVYDRDAGKIKIYYDGGQPVEASYNAVLKVSKLALTFGVSGGRSKFKGKLDEIKIYNSALNHEEIGVDYKSK